MEEKKTIYDLDLHQFLKVDSSTVVRRVPNGWIYYEIGENRPYALITSTFVPFNDEFETANK